MLPFTLPLLLVVLAVSVPHRAMEMLESFETVVVEGDGVYT